MTRIGLIAATCALALVAGSGMAVASATKANGGINCGLHTLKQNDSIAGVGAPYRGFETTFDFQDKAKPVAIVDIKVDTYRMVKKDTVKDKGVSVLGDKVGGAVTKDPIDSFLNKQSVAGAKYYGGAARDLHYGITSSDTGAVGTS